ncbi:hypothetical protein NE237_021597 [Protea cynaroides]|uniref:Uncharacterized protein n=1 Tax=Protea cynaroides TaxID=273540 RepID=A0A9Q0H891_9MAGN|nr:hypothetical protein NE237_021597 [Protea cynaroides]
MDLGVNNGDFVYPLCLSTQLTQLELHHFCTKYLIATSICNCFKNALPIHGESRDTVGVAVCLVVGGRSCYSSSSFVPFPSLPLPTRVRQSFIESVEYTASSDVSSSVRTEREPKPSSSESTFGNRSEEEEEETEGSPMEEAPLASIESASESSGTVKMTSRPTITSTKRAHKKKSRKLTIPRLDSILASKIKSTVYSEVALAQLRIKYQIPSTVPL